jgi:hypothetical protein
MPDWLPLVSPVCLFRPLLSDCLTHLSLPRYAWLPARPRQACLAGCLPGLVSPRRACLPFLASPNLDWLTDWLASPPLAPTPTYLLACQASLRLARLPAASLLAYLPVWLRLTCLPAWQHLASQLCLFTCPPSPRHEFLPSPQLPACMPTLASPSLPACLVCLHQASLPALRRPPTCLRLACLSTLVGVPGLAYFTWLPVWLSLTSPAGLVSPPHPQCTFLACLPACMYQPIWSHLAFLAGMPPCLDSPRLPAYLAWPRMPACMHDFTSHGYLPTSMCGFSPHACLPAFVASHRLHAFLPAEVSVFTQKPLTPKHTVKSRHLQVNCINTICFYTHFITRYYHSVCVILVFKRIPKDVPNRDRKCCNMFCNMRTLLIITVP